MSLFGTADPRDANIDTYLENIRNMILKGADAAIPKRAPGASGVHQHSSKWWNEECAETTSAKRRALQTFQANMSEENKVALRVATHTCQSVVDSARREQWERFCLEKKSKAQRMIPESGKGLMPSGDARVIRSGTF